MNPSMIFKIIFFYEIGQYFPPTTLRIVLPSDLPSPIIILAAFDTELIIEVIDTAPPIIFFCSSNVSKFMNRIPPFLNHDI